MPKERRSRRLFLLQQRSTPSSPPTSRLPPLAASLASRSPISTASPGTPVAVAPSGTGLTPLSQRFSSLVTFLSPSPTPSQEQVSAYSQPALAQVAMASLSSTPTPSEISTSSVPATPYREPAEIADDWVNVRRDLDGANEAWERGGQGAEAGVVTSNVDQPHSTVINVGGYSYTRANVTRRRTTYRCSVYRRTSCRGRCELEHDGIDFTNFVPHTCRSNPVATPGTSNVTELMKERVDELAVTDLDKTANQIWRVVNDEFYVGREHAVLYGLTRDQVVSRVHRTRRMHFGGDVHGQIEVPPLALVNGSSMNFFQYHYSYREGDQLHRIIGWAHPTLLQLIRYRRTTLFIDGTFRCVPRPFYQCVVVMCHDRASGCYVPVAYTLATGRSHTTYWNILHFLVVATDHNLDPESITCDYEAALMGAIRDQLPNTAINGCLFHWKQALRKRIKALRIGNLEARIAMESGSMDMLTVIPVNQVKTKGIAYVKNRIQRRCQEEGLEYSAAKWSEFWVYFNRTWIEMFPVELWNVHGINHAIINRTNNPLERFNRELNAAFSTPHPNLPAFVGVINELSCQRVQFLADVRAGRARAPRHPPYELPIAVNLS